jgi:putative transposase
MEFTEKRVARIMRQNGIKARQKTPFRPRTTDSCHDDPIAPNRLKGAGKPAEPNTIWVADITYIWTLEGWLYLAAVMDLCSRKIVGWAAESHMETDLVREALKQALVDRRPAPGLLHHSDRGSQYASSAYGALLHSWQILPSMSAAGNCCDNAAMEAFWSTLKTEAIHGNFFRTREEARLALFDYIETFHNRKRRHSALDFKSPVDFEKTVHFFGGRAWERAGCFQRNQGSGGRGGSPGQQAVKAAGWRLGDSNQQRAAVCARLLQRFDR